MLVLVGRRPAKTQSECRLVIFTLNHVLTAAVVETEDLVVCVEDIGDEREAVVKTEATLQVNLQVRIEIGVTICTVKASCSWRRAVSSVLILVTIDVGCVVGETCSEGKRSEIVSWADIPCVWSGTEQAGMVGAAWQNIGLRIGVAIIGGDAEAVQ